MKGEKENPLRIGGLEQDQVSPGLYPGLPLTPLPALGQRVSSLGQHPASCRSPVSAAGTRQASANRKTPKPRCPVSSTVPSPAKYTSSPFKSRRLQSPQLRGLSSLRLLKEAQRPALLLPAATTVTLALFALGKGTYLFQDVLCLLSLPTRRPQ